MLCMPARALLSMGCMLLVVFEASISNTLAGRVLWYSNRLYFAEATITTLVGRGLESRALYIPSCRA